MAHSSVVCSYSVTATGQTPSNLQAAVAAVPLDLNLPRRWGVVPQADATSTVGNVVTRAITLGFGVATSSSSAPVIDGGEIGSPIRSCALPAAINTQLGAPPIVSFTDAKGSGATATALCGIGSFILIQGGSGYSGATKVVIDGGDLAPGGTPAVLTPIIVAGAITGITVVSAGSGYNVFPRILFTDTGGGSGALGYAGLKTVSIKMVQLGQGYVAPTVVLTPLFLSSAPDTSDQAGCFRQWMTSILQQAVNAVVVAADPLVS